MNMIVFDTDGLIKLSRSGIVPRVPFLGVISTEVYREAVIEGKKKLHQDAFWIEQFVHEGKIRVEEVKSSSIHKLGKGESSTLALYQKIKAQAIVSDDKRFLRHLEEQEVPFLFPSEFLLYLSLSKQIKKKDCLDALEKIKDLIIIQNYYDAKEALEDKR